ncbi:uncharacterized protein LOC143258401 [Tachypleus tridentatus]|uniref:uncharacterized protein LOC143258401 n=1 Tax=Tachypleus tridentatus TaxID=6853 RepID=UPI003FD24531
MIMETPTISSVKASDFEDDYTFSSEYAKEFLEMENILASKKSKEEDSDQDDGFEDGGFSAFADIPYDIEQKLQEINAHFEEDPIPVKCDREVRVKFKEDLIDLIVPPSPTPSDFSDSFEGGHDAEYYLSIDYPSDFEEDSISKSAEDEEKDPEESNIVNGQQQSTCQNQEEINAIESQEHLLEDAHESRAVGTDVQLEQNKVRREDEKEVTDFSEGRLVQSDRTDNSKANELCEERSRGFPLHDKECSSTKNDNEVLLSTTIENRNLTCALSSDYSTTEHSSVQLHCRSLSGRTLEYVSKAKNDRVCRVVNGSEINKTNWSENREKGQTPVNMKRPRSARTTSKSVISGGKRLVQSARDRDRNIGQSVSANGDFRRKLPNYGGNARSQYGLTDREREELRKETMDKLEEKKKKVQEESERKKEKHNLADSAFKAWLEQKKVKKQGNCLNYSGTKPRKEWRDAEGAFRAWLARKDEEELRENMLKFYEEQETVEAKPMRSKEEAQNAYKAWLRSKNAQQRKQARTDYNQGSGFRQRKSFTLSQAQRQADILKRTFQAYFGVTL